MNARTAKRLRREAAAVTKGLPDRKLLIARYRDGSTVRFNASLSTRAVYRESKKNRNHEGG